eukprot:33539-Chlamydomonas_euryale.AAC.5
MQAVWNSARPGRCPSCRCKQEELCRHPSTQQRDSPVQRKRCRVSWRRVDTFLAAPMRMPAISRPHEYEYPRAYYDDAYDAWDMNLGGSMQEVTAPNRWQPATGDRMQQVAACNRCVCGITTLDGSASAS